ncbi:hypothetical protein Vafri_15327 [Volvox africanus]|uniref:Uncharacterized protein n=2 Tax=Volvox africanus TaxID=51714 RepID=A0A8J4F4J3_9CHLO|nr:hypothetical protein Vafri_15327 [Volvox africanus]
MALTSAPILGHAHQPIIVILVASAMAACGIIKKVGEPFWVRFRRRSRQKEASCRRGTPLGNVVSDCEARWLLEDLQASLQGETPAVHRMGKMLTAGYGARKMEPGIAASWARSALALQCYKQPEADALPHWSASSLQSEPSSEDEQDDGLSCAEPTLGRSSSWSDFTGRSRGLGSAMPLQRRLSDGAVQRLEL